VLYKGNYPPWLLCRSHNTFHRKQAVDSFLSWWHFLVWPDPIGGFFNAITEDVPVKFSERNRASQFDLSIAHSDDLPVPFSMPTVNADLLSNPEWIGLENYDLMSFHFHSNNSDKAEWCIETTKNTAVTRSFRTDGFLPALAKIGYRSDFNDFKCHIRMDHFFRCFHAHFFANFTLNFIKLVP